MAVIFDGVKSYEGAVLSIEDKMWADGMYEEWAVCWDSEKQEIKRISFGYYGIDGTNLAGGSAAVDATPETWRKVLRSFRQDANKAFCKSVTEYKRGIRKGIHAEVIRGKKVPKGTIVEVFWVGERPTFRSRNYSWMQETETVAGCYDENRNKFWIRADYLKSVDLIKSPGAKERRKFIQNYMQTKAKELGAPWI